MKKFRDSSWGNNGDNGGDGEGRRSSATDE